jgi:hypothetical protein
LFIYLVLFRGLLLPIFWVEFSKIKEIQMFEELSSISIEETYEDENVVDVKCDDLVEVEEDWELPF